MRCKFTPVILLLGSTILTASGVRAQETRILDPIVLRAGAPKVASEVPQSVSVVDAQALKDIAPDNIGDVLDTVPGVAGVGSGSFFGQIFNIRGFGAALAGSESGIVQLLDGEEKYYESYRQGSLFVEPDFLKRVEVLRGPGSSTLYGSGALGGVIAMETIDADDLIPEGATSGGRVKLGYASNPRSATASIAHGWKRGDDFQALAAFAFRKLGDSRDADGNTIVRADSTVPNILLKARKDFGDYYIAGSYQHLEAKGDDQDFNQIEGPQPGIFPGFPGWGVGDILTRDQTAKLVWGWNPADNRLIDATVTLSYTNTIKDVRQGNVPSEPIDVSMLGRRDYGLWKLKAQNVADLSGDDYSHILSAGIETLWQDRTSSVPSSSHPEAKTRSVAIYALSEFDRGPLTINTGLRLERQRTTPGDSVTATNDRVNSKAVEPQISAIYRLNDSWSVFGSLARVNRMPTVDELYDSFRGAAPSPDLKTETGRNVEVGLSWQGQDLFADGDQAAVKVTLFHNRITDMIVRTNGRAPEPAYTNLDRATLKGGEIEASYLAGDWQLGAAVSVVDGTDQDGKVLDSLPNDRIVLSAAWQATDAWKFGARSTLAQGRDKANGTHRGGYGIHDLFAVWTPAAAPGVEVNIGVDNLFNRDYTPATWLTGPAPGRNYKISVTRSF